MRAHYPPQPENDAVDGVVFKAVSEASEACDEAWEQVAAEHLLQSRLIEVAFGLQPASAFELSHLQFCEHCREQLEVYSKSCGVIHEHKTDSLAYGHTLTNGSHTLSNGSAHHVQVNGHPQEASQVLEQSLSGTRPPELLRSCFYIREPIVFPGNEVADASWQFGLLLQLKQDNPLLARQVLESVADRALEVMAVNSEYVAANSVFVCFGQAMHQIGIHLAARIADSHGTSPHVILAHDYFSPKLVCDPEEVENANVLVFVDVVHSGSLLERIASVCWEYNPLSLCGIALIDQSDRPIRGIEKLGLWKSEREGRSSIGESLAKLGASTAEQFRFFDPNAAFGRENYDLGKAQRSTRPIVALSDFVDAQLQDHIQRTDALKQDFTIGKKRYPFAVNVLDLLKKDKESRSFVISRLLSAVSDYSAGKNCVAFHAARMKRAGYIADAVSEATGWPSIPMGRRGDTFALTDSQWRQFASFDNVIVVDAAIRSGETMTAIAHAISRQKLSTYPRVLGACVFNALAEHELVDLSYQLGMDIRAAFSLPLAPPTEEVRHWALCQKVKIGCELLQQCPSEGVREILADYCYRAPAPVFSRRPLTPEQSTGLLNRAISLAVKAESASNRITSACATKSPQAIRHLPIADVIHDRKVQSLLTGIMFNSMKPQFKESAAIALAAAGKFDWMSLEWLKCNEPFLSSPSRAWKSIVMIECHMRIQNRETELTTFKAAAEQFKKQYESRQKELEQDQTRQLPLFNDAALRRSKSEKSFEYESTKRNRVVERVSAFIQAADA